MGRLSVQWESADQHGLASIRGASPLGFPYTRSRAPRRRRAPMAWLARGTRSLGICEMASSLIRGVSPLGLPAGAEIRDEILYVGRRVVFEQLEVRRLTRRRAHAFARHRRAWSKEACAKRRRVVLPAD